MTWAELIATCWLEGEYNASVTDQFIYDLKRTVFDDDIDVLLADFTSYYDAVLQDQIDSCTVISSGLRIIICLHQSLLLRPLQLNSNDRGLRNRYCTRLNRDRALQVAILCIAVDRFFTCSEEALKVDTDQIEWNLSESLPRVVKLLSNSEVESTTRRCAITAAVSVMKRLVTFCSSKTIVLVVDSLLSLLAHYAENLTSELIIDSACTLSCLATKDALKNDLTRKGCLENVNALISILTSTATTSSLHRIHHVLEGLDNLAYIPTIGTKLMKRRRVILVVTNHLSHDSRAIKHKALKLCRNMVRSCDNNSEIPLLLEQNVDLINTALVNAVLHEKDSGLKTSMILALNELVAKKCLNHRQTQDVMRAFYSLAVSKISESLVIESSLSFLLVAGKVAISEQVLTKIVHFTTSFYSKVRANALWLLKDVTYANPGTAKHLVNRTDTLEKFSLIISHGSDNDCSEVIHICKQMVLSGNSHETFCKNEKILKALVSMVTRDPIENRTACCVGTEVVLELMSREKCIPYFFPFTSILPWLVKIANKTSDDKLKMDFIDAIVRFSSAILKKAYKM